MYVHINAVALKKDLLSNGMFTESLFLVTIPIWLTLREASQVYWPASEVLREGKFSDNDLIVSDTNISTGDTLIVLLADLLVQVITGDTMSLSTTDTVQFNMYCSPGSAKPTVNISTTGSGVAVWRKERQVKALAGDYCDDKLQYQKWLQ